MWRCSVAISHSDMMGLTRSGRSGLQFRTISVQDDPTWRIKELNSLLPCWMLIADGLRELAAEVGVSKKTELHILHDILGYRKLATRWIPHESSVVQQWQQYAVASTLLDRYKGKMTNFLDESLLWTKPGLAHTNQTWNANQMKGSISVLLDQKSVPYTMCCEIYVHCGIWHSWGNIAPHCTTKADDKRCLLLHVPAAPALRRIRRHLVIQNFIILHDNARSHTAAAVTDLLHRWQWEILEHLPYSSDISPCDYILLAKMK